MRSQLWDRRQLRYRFVCVDDTAFGTIYHAASSPILTAMDQALNFTLTAPRPLGIDDFDRFTPLDTVYPHLVPDSSVRRAHECPDGGFIAVSLFIVVVVSSNRVHRDNKWCSAGCTSRATVMDTEHLGIEFVVVKFGTLAEMCDWFAQHRCAECDRYLASLIRTRSFGGDDPPADGQFFAIPFGYGSLWDPSDMKIIAHH